MGKYLEALKRLYSEPEIIQESLEKRTDITDKSTLSTPFVSNVSTCLEENKNFPDEINPIPFTDHELAEHKISQLKLRDDRTFLRQQLLGVYGEARLEVVNKYFIEWLKGMDAEPVEIKKENAGRYRANTWLRSQGIGAMSND